MSRREPPAPLAERLVRELEAGGRAQSSNASSAVKLLELGCGAGHDARHFYETGISPFVCDQDPACVESLKALGMTGQVFDLRSPWPLPSTGYELIYSHFVLSCNFQSEHIEHIFREMHRVLRPAGKIYLSVRSIEDPTARRFSKQGPGYFSLGDTGLYFFSLKRLRSFAQGWHILHLAPSSYERAGEPYGVLELIAQKPFSCDNTA